MVRRRDLLGHFEWLAESDLVEEALDEALIAIALCAHGHGRDLMEYGAAWRPAAEAVAVYRLERFVEAERAHRERHWGPPEDAARATNGYAGIS